MDRPPSLEPEHLFGRVTERRRLALVWASGARWVTLVGPPGAGKTRLAQTLGGHFVDLVGAQDHAAVCRRLGAALGMTLLDEAPDAARARIGRALAEHDALLVLDNLEQLDALDGLAAEWMAAAPKTRWLGTSRRAVGIAGEVVVPVLGLEPVDAVALFRARAWAAGVELPCSAEVEALVMELDGLPLALELAAARTPLLDVAALRRAVAREPQLLRRSGGGRHAALDVALETSWALLTPALRASLGALAVFRTPMTLPAAAAVLGRPLPEALDTLESLRATGWLRVEAGEPNRYRLYVGVGAFVAARAPAAEATRRHCTWHGAEGRRLFLELRGRSPGVALDALAELAADLELAATSGAATGEPSAAAWAAIGLHALTADRGPWHVGTALLDAALAALPPEAPVRVDVLLVRGVTRVLRGAYESAALDLEAAHSQAFAQPDAAPRVAILGALGPLRRLQGHAAEALTLARAELAIARAHGLLRAAARALFNLAGAEYSTGDVAQAEATWDHARAAALEVGDVRIAAICLTNRSICALESGRLDEADRLMDVAAVELQTAELPVFLGKLLAKRVHLALARGDDAEALARIAEGRATAARLLDVELARELDGAAAKVERCATAQHVDPTGRFFTSGVGASVDLQRRPVLRRVMAALASESRPLGGLELAERAWPGERIRPDAAANRVYTAVRALRRLGAPISTHPEGGYFLRVEDPAASTEKPQFSQRSSVSKIA